MDASKKDVLISKVTWMNFGQAVVNRGGREVVEKHPNEVWLRYTYISAEPWSKVSLLKGREKKTVRCKSSYAGVIPKWSWC